MHRGTLRRLALVLPLALAALLLALLGPTVPANVSMATSSTSAGAEAPGSAGGPALDADATVAQLDHLLIADAGEPGVLTVSDARYSARFDASGFTLAPRTGDDGFGVSLRNITRGHDIPLTAGGWTGDGNVAQRTVADGIAERVTASEGSVEWDVLLDRAPAGAGDLVVTADISGAPTGATAATTTWSVDGHTVEMGEMVVKDAGGTELYRALPEVTDTGVALVVPEAVLAAADYPLLVDPVISPAYPVTTGDPAAYESDIAFDGTNHLVVWKDARDAEDPFSDTRVYGGRLTPSGSRLDGNGFVISDDAVSSAHPPTVAFDGANFFVVWHTSGDDCPGATGFCIRGARVSPAGSVLDPAGIVLAAAGNDAPLLWPDVAFDGTNHLVVYQDTTGGGGGISAVRMAPNGTVATPFPVSRAATMEDQPAVASDGAGGSLIVWSRWQDGDSTLSWGDIYGSRVGSTGGAPDPDGFLVSGARWGQQEPAVAWNGRRYLVVWEDDRDSPGGNQGFWAHAYGARVARDGTVEDPSGFPIRTSYIAEEPSVAANGPTFLVVWSEGHAARKRIYGTRVNDAGVPLDPDGLVIASDDAVDSSSPSVTRGRGSTWGTTYGTGERPWSVQNLFMRTVAPK